jgi:cephalosporin-C deacetylase-like acetyl esterase
MKGPYISHDIFNILSEDDYLVSDLNCYSLNFKGYPVTFIKGRLILYTIESVVCSGLGY